MQTTKAWIVDKVILSSADTGAVLNAGIKKEDPGWVDQRRRSRILFLSRPCFGKYEAELWRGLDAKVTSSNTTATAHLDMIPLHFGGGGASFVSSRCSGLQLQSKRNPFTVPLPRCCRSSLAP